MAVQVLLLSLQKDNRRNTLNFFKRNNAKNEEHSLVFPAPATLTSHPFSYINGYTPLSRVEVDLYKSLREAVPIIDAAIEKTVRLIGSFQVEAEDRQGNDALKNFLENVKTCGGNRGIYPFITTYLNEMLTYGRAVGEMVLTSDNSTIGALYIANQKDVEIVTDGNPLNLIVCRSDSINTPVKYQELILPVLLNPEPGTVKGTSVLNCLPFVSSILLKIFNSIGNNWERVGNVRFAVTYRPDGTSSVTEQQARQIADEWSKAMRSSEVCDFVSVGDVSVKVIGADNQVLDCDVPIKHILEQIVAKLALPPFVLGLSWSSTERMSTQQADILTSELEYYRLIVTPVIKKICDTFLMLNGYRQGVSVNWDLINLQDEVELSQVRLNNAQASEIENRIKQTGGVQVEDGNSN